MKAAPLSPTGITRTPSPVSPHPAGKVRYSGASQIIRLVLAIAYTLLCIVAINTTQFIGAPLYLYNKDWYYAYMSLTKQSFGIFVTTLTQWWSPTVIRVSGDKSVRGQIKVTSSGLLECDFPERMVFIANHQLYSDWLYIWWIAYTARMHGAIYIILKESLKWIPIGGWGMQFYGFIFLARNWAKDKVRFQHRLQQISEANLKPEQRSPMWLLIFPEGTNLSKNGRNNSRKYADKMGINDMQHLLLPRITGLQYCLQELGGTVEWLYDCTMAYEGIPRDKFGQDFFTLRSTLFEGRPPKSVNLHFRRFRISEIPYNDTDKFSKWVMDRWIEKDELMEIYMSTGRLPGDDDRTDVLTNGNIDTAGNRIATKETGTAGVVETTVRLRSPLEVVRIFAVLGATILTGNIFFKSLSLIKAVTGMGTYTGDKAVASRSEGNVLTVMS